MSRGGAIFAQRDHLSADKNCGKKSKDKAVVIAGAVIEKDGKYLLVQEANEKCRGKWNLPAGHLDPGETIIEAAKREAKEETGCEIEPVSICQIGNRVVNDGIFMSVIFEAELLREEIVFDKSEILDVKWFSYDEILAMREQIRNEVLMLGAINNIRSRKIASLEIINLY